MKDIIIFIVEGDKYELEQSVVQISPYLSNICQKYKQNLVQLQFQIQLNLPQWIDRQIFELFKTFLKDQTQTTFLNQQNDQNIQKLFWLANLMEMETFQILIMDHMNQRLNIFNCLVYLNEGIKQIQQKSQLTDKWFATVNKFINYIAKNLVQVYETNRFQIKKVNGQILDDILERSIQFQQNQKFYSIYQDFYELKNNFECLQFRQSQIIQLKRFIIDQNKIQAQLEIHNPQDSQYIKINKLKCKIIFQNSENNVKMFIKFYSIKQQYFSILFHLKINGVSIENKNQIKTINFVKNQMIEIHTFHKQAITQNKINIELFIIQELYYSHFLQKIQKHIIEKQNLLVLQDLSFHDFEFLFYEIEDTQEKAILFINWLKFHQQFEKMVSHLNQLNLSETNLEYLYELYELFQNDQQTRQKILNHIYEKENQQKNQIEFNNQISTPKKEAPHYDINESPMQNNFEKADSFFTIEDSSFVKSPQQDWQGQSKNFIPITNIMSPFDILNTVEIQKPKINKQNKDENKKSFFQHYIYSIPIDEKKIDQNEPKIKTKFKQNIQANEQNQQFNQQIDDNPYATVDISSNRFLESLETQLHKFEINQLDHNQENHKMDNDQQYLQGEYTKIQKTSSNHQEQQQQFSNNVSFLSSKNQLDQSTSKRKNKIFSDLKSSRSQSPININPIATKEEQNLHRILCPLNIQGFQQVADVNSMQNEQKNQNPSFKNLLSPQEAFHF